MRETNSTHVWGGPDMSGTAVLTETRTPRKGCTTQSDWKYVSTLPGVDSGPSGMWADHHIVIALWIGQKYDYNQHGVMG